MMVLRSEFRIPKKAITSRTVSSEVTGKPICEMTEGDDVEVNQTALTLHKCPP